MKNKTILIDRILIKHQDKNWHLDDPKTKSSFREVPIGDTLVDSLKKHRKWQLENKMRYGNFYKNYYIKKDNSIFGTDSVLEYKITDEQVDFVCTQDNGTVVNSELVRYCSRVINYSLNIQFNFHALRHTHATLLIEAGANMKDVQERLGHSKLSTTMDTYVETTQKMKSETVSIFESVINK